MDQQVELLNYICMQEIFLTSSVTIFGGVSIYVLGRIIEKFFIDPIIGQREIVGEIANSLIFYSYYYSNPINTPNYRDKKYDEASKHIRKLSSLLNAKTNSISFYLFFTKVGIVLPKENIFNASRQLIGLSNSFYGMSGIPDKHNVDKVKEIKKLLKIETI